MKVGPQVLEKSREADTPTLLARLSVSGGTRTLAYQLGPVKLHSDYPLPALTDYACTGDAAGPSPRAADTSAGTLILDDEALVADALRSIRCEATRSGYRLAIAPDITACVDRQSRTMRVDPGSLNDRELALLLTGPLLPLTLIQHGLLVLHASAVDSLDGRRLIFLGESGSGKSTFSRYLAEHCGLRPGADDQVPMDSGGWSPAPWPQPKWPQWGAEVASGSRRPAAIICLRPDASAEGPILKQLSPGGATVTLLRHTVASRLFSRDDLGHHLRQVAALARCTPVAALCFRQQSRYLPAMADLVQKCL